MTGPTGPVDGPLGTVAELVVAAYWYPDGAPLVSQLRAALTYAANGLAVLPIYPPSRTGCSCQAADACTSPGKHPLLRHGAHQASTDVRLVRQWWRRRPDANVAVRTGDVVDVCDIDTDDALRDLLDQDTHLGPWVRTGTGWHLWFAATGHGNRVGVLPGIDWRGRGGYALAPPSRHPTGARYRWILPFPQNMPGPCPPALAARLDPHGPELTSRAARGGVRDPGRYAAAALDRELAAILAAPRPYRDGDRTVPGGRNDALNRAAFSLAQLAAAGLLDQRDVWSRLAQAAAAVGLDAAEARRTMASGWRAGWRHPRR